jgi:phosphoadenosine phosphosulfate reductase
MEELVLQSPKTFEEKVQTSIDRIRQFEPPEGYYVAFSGGKDSQTVYHLCKEAGVKFDAHYNLTTVDPPELVYFIRDNYSDVIFEKPKMTMWECVLYHGMPTRRQRFCCKELKEHGGEERFTITGVRWAESPRRKDGRAMLEKTSKKKEDRIFFNDNDDERKLIEICSIKSKRVLNPIIDWEDREVWEYLKIRNLKYCKLYDEGFSRLGCVGCPIAQKSSRIFEFQRYPKYYNMYLRTVEKWLKKKHEKGTHLYWQTAQDVMDWWIYEMPNNPDQLDLFEDEAI